VIICSVQTDQYDVSQWFNSSTTVEQRRLSFDVSRRTSTTNLLDSIESKQQQQFNRRQRSSRISTNHRRLSTAPMMTPVAEERGCSTQFVVYIVIYLDFGDNSGNSNSRMLPSIRKTVIRKEAIVDDDGLLQFSICVHFWKYYNLGLTNEQQSINHYGQDEIVNNGNGKR
jgi:hypothetical protein